VCFRGADYRDDYSDYDIMSYIIDMDTPALFFDIEVIDKTGKYVPVFSWTLS